MNTVEYVKKLVLQAIEKASGWITIFGPANGPQPANQYCLVTLKDLETKEHDVINYTETSTTLTEHQRQEATLRFEIQARGNGAISTLHNVVAYLDSSLRDVDFWGVIGSGGHDSIQNISTYQNGKILPVAVMNIDIHTTLPKQNVIEFMNKLDITTKIGNNRTITVTIPEEEN